MKKQTTLLFSALGVAALFVILVAVNYIGSLAKVRVDLTADQAFTLSEGTRKILKQLDTTVQVRLYVTQDEAQMPVMLKTYAARVQDLLDEYRQVSGGKIEIQKLNPQPDSDAEDSARLDGVDPQSLSLTDQFYLGVSVSMLDKKKALPFLDPNRERQLEYDITRAISEVMTAKKPKIGIMSPLQVGGMQSPMMMQMGQGGRPAWVLHNELKNAFDVQEVDMSAAEIPADITTLLVIHPKNITPAAEYAIDQFVLRGGKLVAFVDPLCVLDAPPQAGFGAPPSSSTLSRLFGAWGLQFDQSKVIADANYGSRSRRGSEPTWLTLNENAFSRDDIVTADANNAMLIMAGAIQGTPAEGLKMTPILQSSPNSELVEGFMAQMSGEEIAKKFKPGGAQLPIAVRLTGKFKTAFPEGKPAAEPAEPKTDTQPPTPGLKESQAENTVLIFADADFIQDQVAVQEMPNPFGGQQPVVVPANGNLSLAQGAAEQMSGNENLIALRSRGVSQRPFTVVQEMEEQAQAKFRDKILELETALQDTQRKLSELQQGKDNAEKFILSPEQQAELTNFRKQEADAKKQIKQLRRDLRTEIDSLENRLKWLNIAAVPAAVTLAGLIFGFIRKSKAAAR